MASKDVRKDIMFLGIPQPNSWIHSCYLLLKGSSIISKDLDSNSQLRMLYFVIMTCVTVKSCANIVTVCLYGTNATSLSDDITR